MLEQGVYSLVVILTQSICGAIPGKPSHFGPEFR